MKQLLAGLFVALMATATFAQTDPNYVDFEFGPLYGGHSPSNNTPINNTYFWNNYGIRFQVNSGGSLVDALYAEAGSQGSGQFAFLLDNTGTGDNDCPGVPTTVADDNPKRWDAGYSSGCFFLRDTDINNNNNQPEPLIITYDPDQHPNCIVASGFIYDIDGTHATDPEEEAWRIDAYTSMSSTTPEQTIYVVGNDWNACTGCPTIPAASIYNTNPLGGYKAGDGYETYWEVNTLNPIERIEITYNGDPDRSVGFAFDNFYYCSRGQEPEPLCDFDATPAHNVDGCGVQFYANATPSPTTTILHYFWEFGDGTSSNEANPFHQYPPNGTFLAKLTITGWDGNECCVKEYEIEVNTRECNECGAEIGFLWNTLREVECCVIELDALILAQNSEVLGYIWEFSDGLILQGPSVTRALPGNSIGVCLTVVMRNPHGGDEECCTFEICDEINCDRGSGQIGPISVGGSGESRAFMEEPSSQLPTFDQDNASALAITKIYPNPASTQVNLEIFSQDADQATLLLVDINGNVSMEIDEVNLVEGSNNLPVNVSELKAGIYSVILEGNRFGAVASKVEIQRQ
ncbi:PKD domain-containing protein [Pontibacter sp. G13]|uniref:PKD domain-containing protein n=1 Tax=Pontibacter sp. G13 TaxID=3074898 RepID=UPI00288989B4|nr:PKD domain-containing protein [Pontibacter sp. G13]WNJ19133.1 PKD domain-containing protein [Pontibacter sp. G13]